jgi:very-short-patch-repair endonuclease
MPTSSTEHRRDLRAHPTEAEALIWYHLRARRLCGFKFRRQHPIGPFILDFYCVPRRVAVELDGGQHFEPERQTYDERRTVFLRERGITVLRFNNDLVFAETEAVLQAILDALTRGPSPRPSPRFAGRGRRNCFPSPRKAGEGQGEGTAPPYPSGGGRSTRGTAAAKRSAK